MVRRMTGALGVLLLGMTAEVAVANPSFNQKLALEMSEVLSSQWVQERLSDQGERGVLLGIRFLYMGRALFGPSHYQIDLRRRRDESGLRFEDCALRVEFNVQTRRVMSLRDGSCRNVE